MRMRFVPRQLIAAVMGGALLAGCSGAAIETASIPTGSQLSEYYADDFYPSLKIGDSPRQIITVGMSYVDQHCSEFFNAVEQTNREIEVGKSGFLSASTQVNTLMKIAKASTLAIAGVAAAVEVTKVLLEQYQQQFAFAPHSVELRAIVFDALTHERGDLESKYPIDSRLSKIDAVADIKRYADNCTLSRIRGNWNAAIAKAVREGVKRVDTPIADAGGRTQEARGGGGRYRSVGRYGVR